MRLPKLAPRVAAFISGLTIMMVVMVKFNLDNYVEQMEQLGGQLKDLNNMDIQLHTSTPIPLTTPVFCKPAQKIAFAKTHKTGGSTMQNIFFRYGMNHKLTFAIDADRWYFNMSSPFNANMISNLPYAKLGYDIFTFHSVWNYAELTKVLPSAVYVTLLRDPVDCYESNYVYMGLGNKGNAGFWDINKFAEMEAKRNASRHPTTWTGKNQQLWDLGVTAQQMEDGNIVKEKIGEFDKQFHFVLIAEHFEESLVLLAKILCWKLEDVKYLKLNARKASSKSNMTSETRDILRQWLWADYQLYDHFYKTFQDAVVRYGQVELQEDVAALRKINQKLMDDCIVEVADNSKLEGEFRMSQDMVLGYVVNSTKGWCKPFARSETEFSKVIRNVQVARAKKMHDYPIQQF